MFPASTEKQQDPSCVKGVEIELEGRTGGNESFEIHSQEGNQGHDKNRDLPDAQAIGSPPFPPDASLPSACNTNTTSRLLKKPPVQATIAVERLPTVKDQARSIMAPVGTNYSTKGGGPDYKDQVHFVQPPPPKLPSARGVPVSSIHEDSSTVVAVVLETIDDPDDSAAAAAAAADDDDHNASAEEPPQLDENHEPPENSQPTVHKRLIWAMALLAIVVAGVVVAVVFALDTNDSSSVEATPTETKLTASDGMAYDYFGVSVATSGDTIIVGSSWDDDNGRNSGSAYVFTQTGTTWTEQAKLTASDGAAEDEFGVSVAIAGDTIVVGSWQDDGNGFTNSGSAYVFTQTGTTWTEQAKLMASDGAAEDQFGASVAIAGDTIVVGAYLDDNDNVTSGSAYVYSSNGTTWTEQAKLMASDGQAGDEFGWSLAIANDTIVVGSPSDDDNGIASGTAFVFTRTGTSWTEQAKLTASDGAASDNFGISVAIAGDTIIVGASLNDNKNGPSGSAYVYTSNGTSWTQQAKLMANDGVEGDRFGISVAVAGNSVVVGAYQDETDNGIDSGSAYIFTRKGSTWTEQVKLTASDGAEYDEFGTSVAIANGTVVVGAWFDDDNGERSGSTYTYDLKLD